MWKSEWKPLAAIAAIFLAFFYLPVGQPRFDAAILESLHLARWYAEEHVLLCLIPAFFIAGAIAVFVSQAAVLKYLGARAHQVLAYGVAAVSGTLLAVCSCTVLPLFAGIYTRGAGLGPAVAFLYAGPAINVLAIILTARILGMEIGIARAVGAIVFSVVIGVTMHLLYRREEQARAREQLALPEPEVGRPLWQNASYFSTMVAVLIFANWGQPQGEGGVWAAVHAAKWPVTGIAGLALGVALIRWFHVPWHKIALIAVAPVLLAFLLPTQPLAAFSAALLGLAVLTSTSEGEMGDWFAATWGFAKQILPLLLIGVLISGLLLGRPGHEGLIPSAWVATAVGGNSVLANFFAAGVGAFMYFATLTEVPILQGLIGSGMGKGPALALLLAGPALSLPNMLVIRSVMGTKKTAVFVALVVGMATLSGLIYGAFF